jgi:transcriptional regulator with XRE-family HTH domain
MRRSETESFGEWLKFARESAGVSQRALAERIGIKQPVLSRIENGLQAKMSRDQVLDIAAALGVSTEKALKQAGLSGDGEIPGMEDWLSLYSLATDEERPRLLSAVRALVGSGRN